MAMTGGTAKLVKTGYANYGTEGAINLYVYYKSTQDVATNKSTVYVGMYVTTPTSTYDIGPWTDKYGSYVGTTSNTFNGDITNFKGTRWLVENKSFTVTHDDEGKATATIYWKWGVNSPWGQYVNPSGSFQVTLPQIARASSITSVANANLGSTTNVVWTPKSKSFYYKVKLSYDTWSSTSSAIYPNKTSAHTFTTSIIPYDVANKMPQKDIRATMTATLYTYSDSACTKQVGSADTETFTVTVPDNSTTQPNVNMTLSPVNATGVAWKNLYVQGVSKVKAAFNGSGKYNTYISNYEMRVNGRTYYSPYTSSELEEDGTVNVKGYATDSRGITGVSSEDINVIPYGKPTIYPHTDENEVVCDRCASDGTLDESGLHLRIKARRSYSKIISDGTQHNFCGLYYRYKVSGGSYSNWESLIDRTDTTTEQVDVILDDVCTDATLSYLVQLKVEDDVGKYTEETYTVPTDKVDFNLREGGGGAAFGKYSELVNALEIAEDWDLVMKGNAVTDFITEQGTSGNWSYRKWNSGIAECWCEREVIGSFNAQWGSLYGFTPGAGRLSLPITFVETPKETVMARASSSACFLYAESGGNGQNTATETAVYNVARPTAVADEQAVKYSYYIIGRWK